MVTTGGSSSARFHGVDRFYCPPAVRRHLEQPQLKLQQKKSSTQRPARPRTRPSPAPVESREAAENRAKSDDSSSKPSISSSASSLPTPAGNLDRFLEFTTLIVPAHYFPKTNVRGWRNCDDALKSHPYFCLGDLWESFKEWSAYGAGVPLVLNGNDSVVQYYVPYLSAIQIYVDTSTPTLRSRPGEESDGQHYLDTSSDSSIESEVDRIQEGFASLGTTNHHERGCFVDGDGESCNPATVPVFEYLERDPPYSREPLADKASLASTYPNLKNYKSCDLLSLSWMSVAWYPIYRIPTGPTLRDLDACFLTFHSLATHKSGTSPNSEGFGTCSVSNIKRSNMSATLSLPAFGLASYKFRGSIWTSSGLYERQLAGSLLQAADNWLRLVRVDHPDYSFFSSHHNTFRR
ncbi:hypothetical protein C4D60_Mb05t00050 [Musa balbisiana]|uniref:DUF789 domain-containing protein n=1 Tax=Musa balbisiana TaxID=52838 RepID=A0A4S8JSK7_MUSBA|nr:hypothetical protein C4D60_Mb05t00050 [Musa balbisiana]